MKKMIKKTGLLLFLLSALALTMTACGAEPENDFVGKWECTAVTQSVNTSDIPGMGMSVPDIPDVDITESADNHSSMVIKNGGKATIKLESAEINKTVKGTWTYDENNPSELTVSDNEGNVITIHKQGEDSVYISDGWDLISNRYTFSRK